MASVLLMAFCGTLLRFRWFLRHSCQTSRFVEDPIAQMDRASVS
jgi:hypothetical protein